MKAMHERCDVLTALFGYWTPLRVRRFLVAMNAIIWEPMPSVMPLNDEVQQLCARAIHALLADMEYDAAQFARHATMILPNQQAVSFRVYVHDLIMRFEKNANTLFADLEDDSDATARTNECNALVKEAQAVITMLIVHDARISSYITQQLPSEYFKELAPPPPKMATFKRYCIELSTAFFNGEITLANLADSAHDRWLYG